MKILLNLLPARLIRIAGRLQFRFPILRKPINFIGQSLSGKGVIQRGAGKGLRFDARGCNPGYLAGTSEPLEQDLILEYSVSGAVVYDIGANAGFYATIAARLVGATGTVYAFEPTPELAVRARSNAALNGLDNLEVIEAAVSQQDGTVNFRVGPSHVNNSIASSVPDENTIRVQSVRLDTFVASHRAPSLLLIDAEGAEMEVLESGLETISRCRPVIMVEVHWLGPSFIDYFEQTLKPLGYLGSTYDGKPLCSEQVRYHALLVPDRLGLDN
jgi:FkbM family methyltransferase